MKTLPFIKRLASAGCATLLAATFTAHADYSNTLASFKPVGYWRLNETTQPPAGDFATNSGSLGTALNGAYVGSASHPAAGALVGDTDGAAITTSGQVRIPYDAAVNPSGPFTVECWANSTAAAGGNHVIVQSMVNGQNPANANDRSGWALREVGADLQFLVGTATGAPFYYYYTVSGAVMAGMWQHLVVTYDGTVPRIYIDGVLATYTVTRQDGAPITPAEIAAIRIVPNQFGPVLIGDRGYGGWNFDGAVDELAIYPSALSQSVVASHFSNGTSPTPSPTYKSLVLASSPVAYFRLGEPAYVAPDPSTLPAALNSGSIGAVANGKYSVNTQPGAAAPPYAGFGPGNYACNFSPNDLPTYIGLGNPPELDVVGQITMTAWVKPLATDGLRNILEHGYSTSPNAEVALRINAGSYQTLAWNGADGVASWAIPASDIGRWTFLAGTYDGTKWVLYWNGIPVVTNTTAVGPLSVNVDWAIGAKGDGTERYFKGGIDEVAIFTNALSAAQVQQVYNAANVPPFMVVQPVAPVGPVYEGMSVSLSAQAAGGLPLASQWTKNGVNLTGKTSTSLSLVNVQTSDSGSYALVVTNAYGAVTSSVIALTVQAGPPIIASAPQSQTRYLGSGAIFSATVLGSTPLTYEWLHGSTVIPGAVGTTLTLNELQPSDAGNYTFRAINAYGSSQTNFTLTLSVATKVAAAVVDRAPLAYWRMDETNGTVALDSWGQKNGTLNAGVTNNVAGPAPTAFQGFDAGNKAYALSGASGYVTLPALGTFNGAMTIVAWIKPNGTQPDFAGLVFTRGGTGGGTSGLDYTAGQQIGYHWNDAATSYNWRSGLIPLADQWNFVALVVEPTQATAYLDSGDSQGIQSAVNVATHGAATWAAPRIGSDSAGARDYKGSIDDVAVYATALSAAEIAAIHDAGISGVYTPTPLAFTSQPQSQTVVAGTTATMSAAVAGSQPISYQWQKNGVNIPGAIRKSFTIASAYYTDAGNYSLRATNTAGGIGSTNAVLTVMPTPSVAFLTNDLVLHMPFDGTYLDTSGRGNDGTKIGDPTFVAGKVGSNALHYNTDTAAGAYNYVMLGAPTDLSFGSEVSFSVAFWTKFTGLPGDLPWLANNSFSYGGAGVTLAPSYNQGSWSWYLNDATAGDWNGTGLYAPVQNTLNNGAWHHLVYSFDRTGKASVYRDGVLEDQRSITSAAAWNLDTGMTWSIGQAGGSYGETAAFDIDDMGIWRRALSGYEALSIYNAALAGRSFDVQGPVNLYLNYSGGNFDLSWQTGTLLQSTTVQGPWTPVPGATAPFYRTTPAGAAMFYRVRN